MRHWHRVRSRASEKAKVHQSLDTLLLSGLDLPTSQYVRQAFWSSVHPCVLDLTGSRPFLGRIWHPVLLSNGRPALGQARQVPRSDSV